MDGERGRRYGDKAGGDSGTWASDGGRGAGSGGGRGTGLEGAGII